MKKLFTNSYVLLTLLLVSLSTVVFSQTNYYVSPTGSNANNGLTPSTAKLTIQNAVSIAIDGDIINLANGTYTLTATLNLNHSLSILGQSESGVIINASGTPANAWAINPNKSNTTISNLTILPNGSTGGFPIHVGANSGNPLPVLTNINLSHITISGAKKTAFDFNGIDNLTVSFLTAKNSSSGNGIQFSGCRNVSADHLTTSGNVWGGIAVYVSNPFPSGLGRGSDNINIDVTTSSIGELQGVYNQNESGFINTNIHVNIDDYTVQNVSAVGYTYYFANKSTALTFASSFPNASGSVVKQLSVNQFIVTPPLTIQAAINAAVAGDVINVFPGIYTESAPGSTLFNGGVYTFGLFVPASKPGISIVGVTTAGTAVNNYNGIVAHVQANATNNFGPSGVFVEGDNVTITGLDVYLDPAGSQNKTVEVIGENFTMKNCRLSDGNSLYINDWRYNTATDISHITKYRVEGNRFEKGTSLDISSGAGKSGLITDRQIVNNFFDAAGGNWAMVSFNGSNTGVPWYTYTVGGAVITGNQFVHGEQYIRHRGTVDNSQFNWAQYWNNNIFDKSVITLADEAGFTPRDFSYPGTYGTFNNVKRIGTIIQSDITNVAHNADLVKIGAGVYTENITVTKEVELRGLSQPATKIIPAISNPDCGGSGGASLCAGASNVILVQANNVTIDQLTIDGNNPSLNSGTVVNGSDVDARNGIITNHVAGVYNNLNVHNVQVQNIFLRGIYASSGGSFNFANNTVVNTRGNSSSIAIFNFGGSGSITNNTVINANDAIASNWSTGTTYTGNSVSNSGSGIHTDNNGGFGGNADLIMNNQVSANASPNGYGIWVFAPYRSVVVKNNVVTGIDVGLASAGQQAAVTTTFSGNFVNGQNSPGSTGVYVTTDLFGFGTSNVSAVFENNIILNNTDGFYLESQSGKSLILSAHNNAIVGNSNSNVTQGVGTSGLGTFSADMKCNWWGTTNAGVINGTIAAASVDHSSWLSNGIDNEPATPGFQPAGVCASPVTNVRVTSSTNVTCYGSSNGSVVIEFDNGLAPQTYSVDGGSPVAITGSPFTVPGLAAGSHTVIVTDGLGSTSPVIFTIAQPAPITANFVFTPILCNGGLSTQNVTITGGTAPYNMTNQGGGAFVIGAGEGITYGGNTGNTYAANYVYTVTDANGCQYVFNANITQPDALQVSSSATPIVCNGSSAITINATGGTAPYNGTGTFNVTAGTYTYTVTDANGCSAATTVTPSIVADTEKPVVNTQSVTVYLDASGTATVTAAQVNNNSADNCAISSYSLNKTSFTCSNLGNNTVVLTVTDASGNSNTKTAIVTVKDITAPTFTVVPAQTFCTNTAGTYTIPVLMAADNCSASVSYTISGATTKGATSGNNASGAFNVGSSTINWTITDASGNSVTTSTTVTITAMAPTVITASGSEAFCNKLTLTASNAGSGATYKWISGSSVFATTQQISLGQSNGDGIYQVTATVGGCTSAPASYNYQKQNLVSSYTILAFDNVDLGENNIIASGNVGVTSSNGKIDFDKNSSVSSPGSFVKAKNIDMRGQNINITNPIYSAATGITLPVMLLNTANANNLPNKDVAQNSVSTVSGNYKNITLHKGSRTTLTGNIFGSIRVEQGAQVTFTATTISIDQLQVTKGPRYGYSYVRFAPDTKVLVSTSVSIGSQVYINPDNYKVTFYMGDKKSDAERFSIKGGDTKVTANIYVPNGKLKVTGGYSYGDYGSGHGDCDRDDDDDRFYGQGNSYVYMTGLFIAEEIEGNGKNVTWNSFDCNASPVPLMNTTTITQTNNIEKEAVSSEEELKVTVAPNPSTTYFTLKIESKYTTPVNLRVMDSRGRVVDAKSQLGSNSTIQIGHDYASGTYYAEMIQGTQRKVVQLIKARG
jgi:hypothetical protein